MRRHLVCLLLGASLATVSIGCGPSRESTLARRASHDDQLRARASFDLQCPKDSLEIVPIKQEPTVFHEDILFTVIAGVRGCNQQVTYVYEGHRGLWLLNTDSRPAQPAQK